MGDIIARKVRHKPFMLVTIDEHSGEGGFDQVGSLCDMLRRKKVQGFEDNLSPYGLHAHSLNLLQGLHRGGGPSAVSERTLALGSNMRLNSPVCRLRSVWAIILRPWKPRGYDTDGRGWGPCRFGYMSGAKGHIAGFGYDFHMVILEAPDPGCPSFCISLNSWGKGFFMEAIELRFAWYKLAALEKAEEHYLYVLPAAVKKKKRNESGKIPWYILIRPKAARLLTA